MAHPIENILKTTMEELKEMVDVNTIVGDPVMTGSDTVIVPVSKVSLGFLSGGGEYGKRGRGEGEEEGKEGRYPFAGTSVAGVNLTPVAFLTITHGMVKVLPANYNCTLDRIIEKVPDTIRELEHAISDICGKKKECCKEQDEAAPKEYKYGDAHDRQHDHDKYYG